MKDFISFLKKNGYKQVKELLGDNENIFTVDELDHVFYGPVKVLSLDQGEHGVNRAYVEFYFKKGKLIGHSICIPE